MSKRNKIEAPVQVEPSENEEDVSEEITEVVDMLKAGTSTGIMMTFVYFLTVLLFLYHEFVVFLI
jgi:hypothetical protein